MQAATAAKAENWRPIEFKIRRRSTTTTAAAAATTTVMIGMRAGYFSEINRMLTRII